MSMDGIHYRDAFEADAEALASFFKETFEEAYGHLYRVTDLTAFLGGHSAGQWARELRDNRFAVRVAVENGRILGFAKIGPLKLPVIVTGSALELRQLYVHEQARGSGVAAHLIDWVVGQARARRVQNLFLSVYSESMRAQRFYARHGFAKVGSCTFMVGDEANEDLIMKLAV